LNFFENIATVQFDHRLLAYSTLASSAALLLTARRIGFANLPPPVRKAVHSVVGMAGVQALLGISTLMMLVPVPLGVLHQVHSCALLLPLWCSDSTRPLA
jgi:cytochrome c oxidase assembly protein subunit 15